MHRTLFCPRLALTTILILVALSLGSAFPAHASPERVLLIDRPSLFAASRQESASSPSDWQPGRRLKVLDVKRGTGGNCQTPMTWYKVQNGRADGWLPDAFLAPAPAPVDPEKLKTIGTEPVDSRHGLAPEYQPPDLVAVGPAHDKDVSPRLRREAAAALKSMFAAARAAGVRLDVVSGFRAWSKQQELYARRVRQSGWGQQTVAKPGHSEHQLGTAVDLSDGNAKTLLEASFGDTPAGRWLHDNAWTYGFAISFTRHNEPKTGIAPEPWHYRYWGIAQARTKHREALGE